MEIQIICLLSSSSPSRSELSLNYGEEVKNSLVLDGVVSLEGGLVDGEAGQSGGLALGDHHCHFELGHEGSGLFGQD